MSFRDDLEKMSIDTQAILADETITIQRVRPLGTLDPITFERSETVQPDDVVEAVTGEEQRTLRNGRIIVQKSFTIRAADTTFRPSPDGIIIDSAMVKWKIFRCENAQGHREYIITAERIG